MTATADLETTKNAVILDLFPDATNIGRGGDEVNGLKKGTIPQNCIILLKTNSPWDDDRTFYLALYETPEMKAFVEIRICKAMEGSEYDEFAVIHKFTTIDPNTVDYSDIVKSSYTFRITEY